MWFIFGFITFISFSVYFGYRRLNASWKGQPGKSGGNPYQYKVATHKGKTVALLVGIDGPPGLDFSFRKENGIDRLFKFLGLSQEHEIGNQEFDEMVYIVSDNTNFHKLISSRTVIKESAIGIFKLTERYNCKTKEIRCHSGRLWVRFKTGAGFDKSIVSSLCAEVLPQLSALAGELKKISRDISRRAERSVCDKSGDNSCHKYGTGY